MLAELTLEPWPLLSAAEEQAVYEHGIGAVHSIGFYFVEQRFTDVEIRASDGVTRCHSSMLAIMSPFMRVSEQQAQCRVGVVAFPS